jgi:hypothetical protein
MHSIYSVAVIAALLSVLAYFLGYFVATAVDNKQKSGKKSPLSLSNLLYKVKLDSYHAHIDKGFLGNTQPIEQKSRSYIFFLVFTFSVIFIASIVIYCKSYEF